MNGNWKLGRTRPWVVLAQAVVLACGLLCASSALAKKPPQPPETPGGWEVIILHPIGGYGSSFTVGVSGGQQVGDVEIPVGYGNAYYHHAWLWNGAAESWVDLNPPGAYQSGAYGVCEGQQVGYAAVLDQFGRWHSHAGLWSGTAESWVDLHPESESISFDSFAYGTGDGQQVGAVGYWSNWELGEDTAHAALWSGTAESYVDLHPANASSSSACGVAGGQQVGSASFTIALDDFPYYTSECHASLWSGTAESWVDLHPHKAIASCANDVSDGQQVGSASFNVKGENQTRAGMWAGNASSWVDLHPSGYEGSEALGVCPGFQAGCAWVGDEWRDERAGIWNGTAESWVDLHALLPAHYLSSNAQDIEVTSTDIWVAGGAYNATWPGFQAVLWHKKLSGQ